MGDRKAHDKKRLRLAAHKKWAAKRPPLSRPPTTRRRSNRVAKSKQAAPAAAFVAAFAAAFAAAYNAAFNAAAVAARAAMAENARRETAKRDVEAGRH